MAWTLERLIDRQPSRTTLHVLAGALVLAALSGAVLAQPANDECATAQTVIDGEVTFDLLGATSSVTGSCDDPAAGPTPDVWFSYTPSGNGFGLVTTCGLVDSFFGTVLTVFDGCGGPEIACNNGACGEGQSTVSFPVLAGHTYLIRLASADVRTPSGSIRFALIPACGAPAPGAPSNDCCGTATLVGNGRFAFTTVNATRDYAGPCDQTSPAADVWFDYIAPTTGFSKIRPDADAPGDVGVTVLEGSCGGPQIVCASELLFAGDRRQVVFATTAGQHYLIRLHGTHLDPVSGHVLIDTALPPANDECTTAASITGAGTFPFDNTLANNSGPDDAPQCDGFGGMGIAHDVWFRWTNTFPAGQDAVISLCGGTRVDTKIAVYHDGCPVGAPLDCNDDFCFLQSQATFPATPGAVYLIRIGTWPGMGNEPAPEGKPGFFTISSQPTCAVNQPANAIVEPEPCGQTLNDGFDPDCATAGQFTDIAVTNTVTIFGTAPVLSEVPDQDMYRVTLDHAAHVTFSGIAEFPMTLAILDTQCPQNLYIRNRFPYQPCQDPSLNPLETDLDPGTYVFAVANARPSSDCGARNNYAVTISLVPCVPASVTTDPVDITTCSGAPAEFTVVASGTFVNYQWSKDGEFLFDDGEHVSGAFSDHLTITNPVQADVGLYTCTVTNNCGAATSNGAQLTLGGSCGAADLGGAGGLAAPCGDGHLDNNDFIVFINEFFTGGHRADLGRAGGLPGSDGAFDNNDFVAFISLFFAGCNH